MKNKYWFIVGVVIFFLLVGGNIFKSKAIEKKEAEILQLEKKATIYRTDIAKIHNKNLNIFKDNKEIKKRFDILVKEKQKIEVIVETKVIEVDKELYVPKIIYDNLSVRFDEVAEECNLLFVNIVKLELNEIEMQKDIKGLEKINKDINENKDDIIKLLKTKLKRKIHFGFGLGAALTPNGDIKYGVTFGFQYKIF